VPEHRPETDLPRGPDVSTEAIPDHEGLVRTDAGDLERARTSARCGFGQPTLCQLTTPSIASASPNPASPRAPHRVRHNVFVDENDAQALALAPERIGRALGQRRETAQRHGAERLDLVEIDVVERDPPPAEPALDDRERLLAPGEIVVRGLVVACRESSYRSRSP
jgi:hypothetical protein